MNVGLLNLAKACPQRPMHRPQNNPRDLYVCRGTSIGCSRLALLDNKILHGALWLVDVEWRDTGPTAQFYCYQNWVFPSGLDHACKPGRNRSFVTLQSNPKAPRRHTEVNRYGFLRWLVMALVGQDLAKFGANKLDFGPEPARGLQLWSRWHRLCSRFLFPIDAHSVKDVYSIMGRDSVVWLRTLHVNVEKKPTKVRPQLLSSTFGLSPRY